MSVEEDKKAIDASKSGESYKYTAKELSFPETIIVEQLIWFANLMFLQKEGIDKGVRPQNIRGLPIDLDNVWRREVWNIYRKSLSNRDNRGISQFTEGKERHTHPVAPPSQRQEFPR